MTLQEIQAQLKAPKSQYNSFGKYHYRNCEDILEAVKPLLGDSILTLSDEVVNIGEYNYVKATASFKISINSKSTPDTIIGYNLYAEVTAYAREAKEQKGMNDAQITGSSSSYARKYALNGLFLIDDTKDDDTTNKHGKEEEEVRTTNQTASKAETNDDLGF